MWQQVAHENVRLCGWEWSHTLPHAQQEKTLQYPRQESECRLIIKVCYRSTHLPCTCTRTLVVHHCTGLAPVPLTRPPFPTPRPCTPRHPTSRAHFVSGLKSWFWIRFLGITFFMIQQLGLLRGDPSPVALWEGFPIVLRAPSSGKRESTFSKL